MWTLPSRPHSNRAPEEVSENEKEPAHDLSGSLGPQVKGSLTIARLTNAWTRRWLSVQIDPVSTRAQSRNR